MASTNAVNGVNNLLKTVVAEQVNLAEKFVKTAVTAQVSGVQGLGQDTFVPSNGVKMSPTTYGANGTLSE